jgi:hypothetical protein
MMNFHSWCAGILNNIIQTKNTELKNSNNKNIEKFKVGALKKSVPKGKWETQQANSQPPSQPLVLGAHLENIFMRTHKTNF